MSVNLKSKMNDGMEKLKREIESYRPINEQEERDREMLLAALGRGPSVMTREDPFMHFTASAWVTSPDHGLVLMAYHNLYDSWSWLGGHADGETDLLKVAEREVKEESGVSGVRCICEGPVSLEVLTVDGHVKRGVYVSSHLHLNVTYLFEADPGEQIRSKADENSAVGWFAPDEAVAASSEPWFREHIYKKLNRRL